MDMTPNADAFTSLTRDEILDRIEERWEALWLGIHAVPVAQRTEPDAIGYWRVQDLLGHLAFWETYAVESVTRILANEPDPDIDVEAINERVYHERRDWSWDHAVEVLRGTHAALLSAVATLPPTLPPAAVEALSDDSWMHYDEHLEDINDYLERNTPATA